MSEQRFTVRYRNREGLRIELCVNAESVTEAIEAVRNEVPDLKMYPGRINAVIGGCE